MEHSFPFPNLDLKSIRLIAGFHFSILRLAGREAGPATAFTTSHDRLDIARAERAPRGTVPKEVAARVGDMAERIAKAS